MDLLTEPKLMYLSLQDLLFVDTFNGLMNQLGYDFGGTIGDGYCWGKHMLIYRKTGARSPRVYARVNLREVGSALRLYLNDLDNHRLFLEHSPDHIKSVFTGPHGDCQHCQNEKGGGCRFRKTYTLDGHEHEKCNGIVFEFQNPTVEKVMDFQQLFLEFYPDRRKVVHLDFT